MFFNSFFESHFISEQEKVRFIKNFATMLHGGIAVNEALHVLAESTETRMFGVVLARMAKKVEQGSSLASVFEHEENIFGPTCVSLLKVGEASGTLDESLVYLSEYLERSYDLDQEIRSAMIYPKFIFIVTIAIAVFLVMFILPKLVPVFAQLHITLPVTTRILLAFMEFLQMYWMYLSAGILLLATLYLLFRTRPAVRSVIDRIWLSMPLFGGLTKEYQLALFCHLFMTLYKTGSPMNDALAVAADAATNVHYRNAFHEARLLVEGGTPFSNALKRQPKLFPANMVVMIATGEQSGALEKVFSALAESYTKEVNLKTKRLPSLIEPALLILIAFVVGFVALSIVMPIYEVTRGLSR